MEKLNEWIYDFFGMSHSFQYKFFATLAIVITFYILRKIVTHFLTQKITDVKIRYNWSKGVAYINYILLLIIILPIWFSELKSLGTFLGLLTAGLAVALKDPISNLFAWAYIIIKKPFEMGDRIQIERSEGDILDIGFFKFTMLEIRNWVDADQSTGRIIHVPNGLLFTKPVANYNQAMNYIWNEIPILITFESNWRKAKKILLEVEDTRLKKLVDTAEADFDKAEKEYHVHYSNLTPTVYTKIKESGVLLTLRYLCHPRMRRGSEQAAFEEILTQFEKYNDIHFAYPTTRFYQVKEERIPNTSNDILK